VIKYISLVIPPSDIRELRDLTRYRRKSTEAMSVEKNRVQKVLEDANIKISSVVSDTFGVSSTAIIEALLAVGKLRKKKNALHQALVGKITEHHTFLIQTSIGHIRSIEKLVTGIDKQIDEKLKPCQEEYELLQTIRGSSNTLRHPS